MIPNDSPPVDAPDSSEKYAQEKAPAAAPDPNETISSETPPAEINPLANCKNLDVDQTTGEFVCRD